MRIGYDAKRYFFNKSGLGNYSRDLIRILKQYYPQNDYLLYSAKAPADTLLAQKAQLPKSAIDRLFHPYWRAKRISKDLISDKVDIYHGLSGEIPRDLYKTKIKSVVTMHDLIFLRYPELYKPADRFLYKKKFQYAVDHADKIVAISEQTKRDLIEFLDVPASKVDTIYQGCHPAFKVEKSTKELHEVQQKYNLPADFVLNVGTIEPRKNAFQIVKALEHTDIPLVIIGKETPYALEIKKYVQERNLQHKILFRTVASMSDLATIYALAKVFIYPSSFEGFGIPIIEALYSGTPVVTTNSGVFPEAAGPFSYYVNPQNTEEIAYATQSILTSSQMQQEMRIKGLEFVQRFNDETLAQEWIDCYRNLI